MTALNTLLSRAESERDLAQTTLRRAEDHARRAQAQADQLLSYRGDYQRRWSAQFSRQGAIEIVHCYRNFMERIDEALAQQREQAAAADAQCQRGRDALLGAEMRVASVRKLIERRHTEQRRVQAQHEQRHNDEAAQQLHWRAKQAAPVDH